MMTSESWENKGFEFLLQSHIHTLRGRILETILSLRFFIFQYGVVYKLNATGDNTSLTVNLYIYLSVPSLDASLTSHQIIGDKFGGFMLC